MAKPRRMGLREAEQVIGDLEAAGVLQAATRRGPMPPWRPCRLRGHPLAQTVEEEPQASVVPPHHSAPLPSAGTTGSPGPGPLPGRGEVSARCPSPAPRGIVATRPHDRPHPITVQKFAMGQSVLRLEDPRLVQGSAAIRTT